MPHRYNSWSHNLHHIALWLRCTPNRCCKVSRPPVAGTGITDYAPTFVTPITYADAFLAAGGTLACLQAVLTGQARNAFAIVRPPGHHAEPEAAMGFCLLNNIAIAARQALTMGCERVIVDFDAHHGNGTQAIFWDETRVAFFSTQQENIYPFRSGFIDDARCSRSHRKPAAAPPFW